VKPLREGDAALLGTYEAFFNRFALLAEIDAATIERATELRARHALRTPDAIHVATALERYSDLLLTGDAALAKCTEIRVELI